MCETLKRWARVRGIPVECTFEITLECNLRCQHCYQRGMDVPGFMSVALAERIMNEIKELGCIGIGFTGGEPLLHPQFWTLTEMARKKGFSVGITTNGTLVGATDVARMKELRFTGIGISLYAATADTHDRLTGVEGSFLRTMDAVRLCRECGLPVHVNCVVTRENADGVGALSEWCSSSGIRIVLDPVICDSADGTAVQLAATREQITRIVSLLGVNNKATGIHRCSAGLTRIAVSVDGTIYPCPMYREAIGSVANASMRVLWQQSPVLKRLRDTSGLPSGECATCQRSPLCPRCPGKEYTSGKTSEFVKAQECLVAEVIDSSTD